MIYFGTSGFSYADWSGIFYPKEMNKRDWLIYYAREFQTCEINSTYYAIPTPTAIQSMVDKTGEDFLFSFKANQKMTHEREENKEIFQAYRRMLEPVIASGKLGCVLAQFPYSFKPSAENRDYLGLVRERLEDLPLVVEFRNGYWLREETFDWLRRHEIGFCCVDEPHLPNLLPPLDKATSHIGYVRFHGRNAAKWWDHEHAWERYDYSYRTAELEEWLPRLRRLEGMTEKTFVFANNHWRGQAVDTARQLRMMLN